MKEILIDSDIFVDFLRGQEEAKKIFEKIKNENLIGFASVITEAELLSGQECNDIEKKHAVDNLLFLVNKVEVDSYIARKAGELRRLYHTSLIDSLIAATAEKLNIPIFTRNIKHFQKIKGIRVDKPY